MEDVAGDVIKFHRPEAHWRWARRNLRIFVAHYISFGMRQLLLVLYLLLSTFVVACGGVEEPPYVIAEEFFDASAKRDSARVKYLLTPEGRANWSLPSSVDRITFEVVSGLDFKIQTLDQEIEGDSAVVRMALSVLNVRDERLKQSIRANVVDTLNAHLVQKDRQWRIAGFDGK